MGLEPTTFCMRIRPAAGTRCIEASPASGCKRSRRGFQARDRGVEHGELPSISHTGDRERWTFHEQHVKTSAWKRSRERSVLGRRNRRLCPRLIGHRRRFPRIRRRVPRACVLRAEPAKLKPAVSGCKRSLAITRGPSGAVGRCLRRRRRARGRVARSTGRPLLERSV
jgi:hypothetical protein